MTPITYTDTEMKYQIYAYCLVSAGNMNPYVASYIRRHSSPSTLRYNDTIWVFALTVTGQGLAMFVGGLLEKKIGTRLAVLSGCFLTRSV